MSFTAPPKFLSRTARTSFFLDDLLYFDPFPRVIKSIAERAKIVTLQTILLLLAIGLVVNGPFVGLLPRIRVAIGIAAVDRVCNVHFFWFDRALLFGMLLIFVRAIFCFLPIESHAGLAFTAEDRWRPAGLAARRRGLRQCRRQIRTGPF